MKTATAKLYEAMFLVDSALAASDWQGVNNTVRSILEKVDAEVVSIDKWDERKLAYDISGKGRGTYLLAYFRVDGGRIGEIERSVQLSENIMRVLILDVEGVDQRYLGKGARGAAAESEAPENVAHEPVDEDVEAPDVLEVDVSAEGEEK